MAKTPKKPNEFSEAETIKRGDEALKRALKMPPKPRTPAKKKRPKI